MERWKNKEAYIVTCGGYFMEMTFSIVLLSVILYGANCCSDFFMNFTDPMLKLSVRTQDIGSYNNYTLTYWPVDSRGVSEHENGEFSFAWTSKYDVLGISGNWIGDDRYAFPAFVMDGVNDRGLSCSMLALVGTKYEKPRPKKNNLFYGTFCLWALQTISSVEDLSSIIDDISIWGPAILSEHFVIRDAAGQSMVIELIDGEKHVYWDANDGVNGFGILTNEPTFDWHISNIQHYEWKRTLARQAVEVPGGWYPEDRYLRVHMVKQGMQAMELFESTTSLEGALSLAAQVLNTITVPEGFQYGTDTGETSGEGSGADHTMFGLIRDHSEPAIYWRDAGNPTLRRVRLTDVAASSVSRSSMLMETGPSFIDMSDSMA